MNICQFTPTGTNMSTVYLLIYRATHGMLSCGNPRKSSNVWSKTTIPFWEATKRVIDVDLREACLKGLRIAKIKIYILYFTYSSRDQWYHSKIGYNFFERELKNINFHFCNFLKTPVLRKTVRLFPFNFFERRPTNT